MILKLKRTPGIYLVGFMGCGKSTVGRLLARELGWTFVDLDHDIEAEHQRSISDIFDKEGEEAFRQMETEALRRRIRAIQTGRPMVIALGGGTFAQPGNQTLIENNGVSIWLDCTLEVVRLRVGQAVHRPLAKDPARMEALYAVRREQYAQADYHIPITKDDSAGALSDVLRLPLF